MKEIDINDLISKVDITNVISNFSTLTKTGASFKTLCNVHGDKSPSLSINPKKQIYKCFVCDHGGNVLDYLIWAQKFTWNEAIEYLIKESGENIDEYKMFFSKKKYSQKEEKLFKSLNDAANIFNYYLSINDDQNLNEFIKRRYITKEDINKFKLGFAPKYEANNNYLSLLEKKGNEKSTLINASLANEDYTKTFFSNKLIFPICDDEGNVVAFSGRKIIENDNTPKYLNSKESLVFKKSKILYNYHNAKKHETIIIVEGYMDVIALAKIGNNNAIALMGTSLTNEHIKKLVKHKEILLFLDNDQAGKNSLIKIISIFIRNNINAFVIKNESFKDPDEILNGGLGKEKLLSMLNNKIKMIDFVFDFFFSNVEENNYDLLKTKIEEISKYARFFDNFKKMEIIKKIENKFKINSSIINEYFINKNIEANMLEFNNLNEINKEKNISIKETTIKENFPLNIRKILISIWKNPSFIKTQNIGYEKWPEYKLRKIFDEIKRFYLEKKPLSTDTIAFIRENEKVFNSVQSLPQNSDAFIELIERANKETSDEKLKRLEFFINTTNNKEQKDVLLDKSYKIIVDNRRKDKKNG